MKIPTAIVTKHKIRDSKILSLYANDSWSLEEIGLRFHISTTRIHQIISKNLHLLKINREHERIKRINKLKRILSKKSEWCPDKDAIDVMDKIREEMDGKGNNDQPIGGYSKVIIIRETVVNESGNSGSTNRIGPEVSREERPLSRSVLVVRE